MAKYKCPTLGDCDKANSGEIFERAPGEDLKCQSCGSLLDSVFEVGDPPPGSTKMFLIVAGLASILVAGGGYYYYSSKSVTTDGGGIIVKKSHPGSTSSLGISPSDADTKVLRQESQEKLISNDAANAERASSQATSNEMIKLAIAKMAQGKLDEAEKDLNDARTRNPKQPLVYYNMAILRLKQTRVNDALREFEGSFMAGFNHFDKMDQDKDLNDVRKDPRFISLVAKYRPLTK
jgi:hypothetical protein